MNLPQVVQYCFAGITVGSIYAIVAIGFNIIYNTTGIINFAQGEIGRASCRERVLRLV